MPMIDVYPAAGTFASKHDLAQQLAAAVMRQGRCPCRASPTIRKRRLVMPASTGTPIKTQALAAQACVPTSYPVDLAAHGKRTQH
jgi:hypothetical protein